MGEFHYERGDQITVRNGEYLTFGVVTGRYHEMGRNIYDYIDHFGSPHWCVEDDVCMLCTRHRSE